MKLFGTFSMQNACKATQEPPATKNEACCNFHARGSAIPAKQIHTIALKLLQLNMAEHPLTMRIIGRISCEVSSKYYKETFCKLELFFATSHSLAAVHAHENFHIFQLFIIQICCIQRKQENYTLSF